jgi:putative FmdB family regulatory protein
MPTYDYGCERCGPFTETRPMAEFALPQPCPNCGDPATRILVAAAAAPPQVGSAPSRCEPGATTRQTVSPLRLRYRRHGWKLDLMHVWHRCLLCAHVGHSAVSRGSSKADIPSAWFLRFPGPHTVVLRTFAPNNAINRALEGGIPQRQGHAQLAFGNSAVIHRFPNAAVSGELKCQPKMGQIDPLWH